MAFDLPNSPATGDTYVLGGKTWRYDGSAWTGVSPLSPGMKVQVFVNSGTYTPSPGMKYCIIEACGGGGGGGGVDGTAGASVIASGGGGGGYSRKLAYAADIGTSQVVTIGAAGTAGSGTGPTSGGAGGDTSVGTLCIGKGGGGGNNATAVPALQPGGIGGVPGTGDVTSPGMHGEGGLVLPAGGYSPGGHGGNSPYGNGGRTSVGDHGAAGAGNGSGGSGGSSFDASNMNGGVGTKGIVVITEFIAAGGAGIASVDNTIARYDGTAGLLQGSLVTITDGGAVGIAATSGGIAITGTSGNNIAVTANCQLMNVLSVVDTDSGGKTWQIGPQAGTADPNLFGFYDGTTHISLKGGAISFPAVQTASAGANDLDDYEEGTWTPTLITDGTQPTIGGYTRNGVYTRIGRQVHYSWFLQVTISFSGGTGGWYVGGLPFTTDASVTTGYLGPLGWETVDMSTGTSFIQAQGSQVYLRALTMVDNASSAGNVIGGWTVNDSCYGSITVNT